MKTAIIAAMLVLTAAGAYAFDFSALFSGCGKPAALKDLVSAQPAGPAADVKPAKDEYPMNLKPAEAAAYISAKKPVVLDIRTPAEYEAGHLAAASLRLDYYAPDFKDQLARLDKGAGYLIYCRSGHRSGLALGLMKDLGFTDAHDIAGGINAWTSAGLPVSR